MDTLAGDGPFTVFAPTDDVPFRRALPSKASVAALLEPRNRDRLVEILTCHVVAAEAFSTDIVGMIQRLGRRASDRNGSAAAPSPRACVNAA